jgi:hypothetical protein
MKPSENSDFGALSQPIDPTDRPAGGATKPFTGTKPWGAGGHLTHGGQQGGRVSPWRRRPDPPPWARRSISPCAGVVDALQPLGASGRI